MMKKFLLSITLALFVLSFVKAQNPLTLSWEGNPIGDTITVWGEPSTIIAFYANVHNNTANAMNLKVARKQIFIYDNNPSDEVSSINYFCWAGLCYSPATDVSPNYQLVNANSSSADYDFTGDYEAYGIVGTSMIEYTFYNIADESQKVSVVVKYWASPVGIAEDAMKGGSISDIYPNPATTYVSLDFDLTPSVKEAKVRVINLLGSVVKETEIERGSNQLKLDISDLDNGVYFYSVIINGDTYKTKKLVVR